MGAETKSTLSRIGSDARRLFRIIDDFAPGVLRWLALYTVAEASATIAMPYVANRLVDAVSAARVTRVLTASITWLTVEVALALLRTAAQRGTTYCVQVLHTRGELQFSRRLLEKACNVSYPEFERAEFVNQLGRASQHTGMYTVPFAVQLFTIARAALVFVGCLALLWTISPWSLPVLIVAAVPSFALEASLARRAFELERANMHRNRQGWYLEWLLTAEQTAKELRTLAAGRWLVALYHRIHSPFRDGQFALAREHFRRGMLPAFLGLVALYGPYLFIVLRTIRGESTIGGMLLFVLAFQQASTALASLLKGVALALEQNLYVRDVLEVLDYPEDDRELDLGQEDLLESAPELRLEDLWFRYPDAKEPVLRGIDLHVRAGETLAIVGRNGIGKTTLVKLLAGLYPLTRGKISLGGIDVSTRTSGWVRQNIGILFQDFVRFPFSVRWNVGIGWWPDADDERAVTRAIEMADAGGIVARLSNGIGTALGTAFGGSDVSGGQWQRLALARLFMRRSRLWILDEPTAAMDPDSEERTFRHFCQWAAGRTTIIIAHRFSTVRVADRIAVVDDGRIVEIGTHEELLVAGGQYAHMFALQTRPYVAPAAVKDDRASI